MNDFTTAIAALTNATSVLVKAISQMQSARNEMLDWAAGTATGGPRADGTYPFTQDNGAVVYVPSPARISAANPNRVLVPAIVTIWAGQSNAVGSPTDRSTDYVADPLTMAYHKVDGLRPYVPNDFAGYSKGNPTGEWGMEMRYAQRLRAAYPRTPHFIVKFAQGGTMLYRSDDGSATLDWNVGSDDELYARARTHVRDALAAIKAAGYDPIIRLVGWVQGENDTSIPLWANAYATNLTAFLRGVRDLDDGWRVGASTPIYIARLSQTFVTWAMAAQANNRASTVRTAQEQVIAASPGGPTILVDTDGLALESDSTHYTKAGLVAGGNAVADLDGLGSPAQDMPGAVTGFAISSTTSTSVTLAFNAAARASSYQYRLNGTGSWEPLPNGKTVEGLTGQTNYSIQVRAMNSGGTGPETAPVGFTTENSGPPPILKNGTFTTAANWLLRTGFSISGGKLHLTDVPQWTYSEHGSVSLIAGQRYKITATVSNFTKGQIVFGTEGGGATIQVGFDANGTKSATFVAVEGVTMLTVKATAEGGTTMDIDDIIIELA